MPCCQTFLEGCLKRSDDINPSLTEYLYCYKPESTCFHAFNRYLLIARYYIYLARYKSETPKLEVFIVFLETKIQCERKIAIKNRNYTKNRNKGTSLCIPVCVLPLFSFTCLLLVLVLYHFIVCKGLYYTVRNEMLKIKNIKKRLPYLCQLF